MFGAAKCQIFLNAPLRLSYLKGGVCQRASSLYPILKTPSLPYKLTSGVGKQRRRGSLPAPPPPGTPSARQRRAQLCVRERRAEGASGRGGSPSLTFPRLLARDALRAQPLVQDVEHLPSQVEEEQRQRSRRHGRTIRTRLKASRQGALAGKGCERRPRCQGHRRGETANQKRACWHVGRN